MNSFSSKSSIFAIIIHKPIKGLAQVQPDIESIGIIKGPEMTHDNLETAAIYILHTTRGSAKSGAHRVQEMEIFHKDIYEAMPCPDD